MFLQIRPNQHRKKEWLFQPVFCKIDSGSFYEKLHYLLLTIFKTVCGKYTRLCLQLLPRIYFYSRALDLAQPTRNPLFSDGNLNWKISAGSQHHNLWNICGGGCSQNCFRYCLKKHKGSRGEMIWGAVRSSCPDQTARGKGQPTRVRWQGEHQEGARWGQMMPSCRNILVVTWSASR